MPCMGLSFREISQHTNTSMPRIRFEPFDGQFGAVSDAAGEHATGLG